MGKNFFFHYKKTWLWESVFGSFRRLRRVYKKNVKVKDKGRKTVFILFLLNVYLFSKRESVCDCTSTHTHTLAHTHVREGQREREREFQAGSPL